MDWPSQGSPPLRLLLCEREEVGGAMLLRLLLFPGGGGRVLL